MTNKELMDIFLTKYPNQEQLKKVEYNGFMFVPKIVNGITFTDVVNDTIADVVNTAWAMFLTGFHAKKYQQPIPVNRDDKITPERWSYICNDIHEKAFWDDKYSANEIDNIGVALRDHVVINSNEPIGRIKGYLVLNQNKTQGFFTTDAQLAYEVRKGADTNCVDERGQISETGIAFTRQFIDETATKHEVGFTITER